MQSCSLSPARWPILPRAVPGMPAGVSPEMVRAPARVIAVWAASLLKTLRCSNRCCPWLLPYREGHRVEAKSATRAVAGMSFQVISKYE